MGPLLGSPGGLTAVIYTDALQTVIMVGGALVLMFLGKEGSCTHPSFAPKSICLCLSPLWFGWNFPEHRTTPHSRPGAASLYAKPGEPHLPPTPAFPCPIPVRSPGTPHRTGSWWGMWQAHWGLRAVSLPAVSPHRLRGGGLVHRAGAAVQAGHP